LDNPGDRPQLFDNRIDMIILDSVTKKFGAFAAVDNVSYTSKQYAELKGGIFHHGK